jgi:hypothetical protein
MAYGEDTSRKDQGWALLDGGSTPLTSDYDDPTITDIMTPVVGKGEGTYRTLSE